MLISQTLKRIAEQIDRVGGNPILVGGAVRDHLLGNEIKDIDIEVFNLSVDQLTGILNEFGRTSVVGKAFGVLKVSVDGMDFDFSLPRKDQKTGVGHKGFSVETDPEMTFKKAASRRDFTINAIGLNLLTGGILDPFNGGDDLKNRILRVVDPETFIEDPLRVFRGIQFAARFRLTATSGTMTVFRNLLDNLPELPQERIFEEMKKLLLKADTPSVGLALADKTGLIEKLFPELYALHNVQQDPTWHPEGDVWAHTLLVLDEAAKSRNGTKSHDLPLMLAALCHDFGKPVTTTFTDGRWISYGHESEGEKTARCFLERLTNETTLIRTVSALVRDHLKPTQLYKSKHVSNGAIRRLAMRTNLPLLVELAQADTFGRGRNTREKGFPAGEWLLERWKELQLHREEGIRPFLMGRHLLKLGLMPGPRIGRILKEAFDLQLDDEICSLNDALVWARKRISTQLP
ncbi:MAG: CCA tRNA nucleotidyltransferase [Deltaproteobacteria bacterium]|nr:CCA tRNA nucleotidyltransferase [Deltaproteobacteria bacterium]